MTEVVVAQRMWQRRGTTALWGAANPVLESGEIGVELSNTSPYPVIGIKIGNGYQDWATLNRFEGSPTAAGISYDNSSSGISATDVQSAIDEIAIGGVVSSSQFPIVTGEVPPVFLYLDDGSLIYGEIY